MPDTPALPGADPDRELAGLLSAGPRGQVSGVPTDEDWKWLDFMRSQIEEIAAELSPSGQANADRHITQYREALENVNFPVHDPRAIHTAMLTSVLLQRLLTVELTNEGCLAAVHTMFSHVPLALQDFGLLMRELAKDAGVRAPIEPDPDDTMPSSDGSPGPRWRDLSHKYRGGSDGA